MQMGYGNEADDPIYGILLPNDHMKEFRTIVSLYLSEVTLASMEFAAWKMSDMKLLYTYKFWYIFHIMPVLA